MKEVWFKDVFRRIGRRKASYLCARTGANAPSWNLWIHPFPADGKPRAYLETPFRKSHAQVSPNGKWLAFTTNETGTDQIVIQAFPDPTLGRRTVTTNGGTFPRWQKDGRELYYLAADRKLMAVHVKDDVAMSLGETTALFQTELPTGTLAIPVLSGFPYDVANNGQRFLLITPIQSATASGSAPGGCFDSIHGNSRLDFVVTREVGDLGTGIRVRHLESQTQNSKFGVRGAWPRILF